VAVKRDDYDEPMTFTFEGCEILGSNILNTEPESLINSVDKKFFVSPVIIDEDAGKIIEGTATIQKFLLNPKQDAIPNFV
jgi:hypothetical protein